MFLFFIYIYIYHNIYKEAMKEISFNEDSADVKGVGGRMNCCSCLFLALLTFLSLLLFLPVEMRSVHFSISF